MKASARNDVPVQRSLFRLGLIAAALAASALTATAAEEGGCGAFKWPLDKEFGWMAAPSPATATAGDKLPSPPDSAVVLKLSPQASVTYPVAPGKAKADAKDAFGGVLTFDGIPKPGVYQVTLSSQGWIDVVQNGAALKSTAHSGISDCSAIRKSVRFEIGSGPFSLQLSGVPRDTIKVAVRAAE